MGKQLTKEEALNQIDQLIQQKVDETGKSYLEISREIMAELKLKLASKIAVIKAQDILKEKYPEKQKPEN